MKPIYTFLCAVLLTIASQATGQNMSSSITTVTQPPYPLGSAVVVDLNVTNFTNISSVLLPITYNSTVLRFDSMSNPAIPDYTDLTPMFHPNPGVIKIAWFPSLLNYPDGFTIAGTNARMITIHFTVIANGNSPINVSTTVPFTPIEVVNAMGNIVFNNNIFNSSGSGSSGVSVTGGVAPPPVGFKIIGNDVYAKTGNRVCVPVTVNDFDKIQDMQFAMHWDVTKLTYECVRGTSAPIVPSFNPPALAPGTLLLLWEDPNLLSGLGVTKPDFTRIYEVCFNTIGAPGTQSSITFDGFGFGFPPDFTIGSADAHNNLSESVWTGANHPNGPSGVGSTVYIMADPPGGVPVTYTMDKDTVAPNMQTCVDIKVKNFSQITESEFAMTYDATKLSLITPFTIPVTTMGILPSNFVNTVVGTTGVIKFKWAKAAGATVSDNTTIFSMCFTAIGTAGVVPITFGTTACPNPTPYATQKKDQGGQPYRFIDGYVNIESLIGPPSLTAVPTNCNTGATGSITVAPGGNATAYAWSFGGVITQNLSNVPAGTYTVTVTYGAAGTATGTATVTAPPAISMSQMVTGVNCQGQSNGSINMTPAGGTAPYTYAWVGPNSFTANTQDLAGIATGNYVVTITDSKQCSFTSPAVNVPSPQALAVSNNNVTILTPSCFGGTNASINITPTGGTTPYTYDWSNDGPEDPDNDPQNIVGLGAGIFTVTITDAKGCTFAPSYTITSPAALATTFIKKENAKCFGTSTGKIEITAASGGSGNKTYVWKTVPGGQQVSVLQNPIDLAPGTYNVTVTDGNGCTTTLPNPVTIDNPPSALTLSNTTTPGLCFGQATGSINLTVAGGWAGVPTFQWTGGLDPVEDPGAVSSGPYTVTVTDAGGCTATQAVTVGGAQSAISIGTPVISNVSCFGSGNGGICITPVGGNGGPYAVSWSSGTLAGACIGTLPPGTYAPIVTDAQMCTEVFPGIVVAGPSSPVTLDTNITVANPMGSIELIVTGGTPNYTFLWTGGITTQNLQGVPADTYTVTVTDANNCTTTGVYTIPTGNILLGNVTVSSIQHSCGDNGCINLSIAPAATSGGPFTVTWNGGSLPASGLLTPSVCGLPVGFYTVTVTASNGNTVTVTAAINQLQPASYNSNIINPTGSLQNGGITISPTFPSTYLWNTGATTAMLSSLDSGYYAVTVTNQGSGCTSVFSTNLKRQYPQLVVDIASATNPACATSTNGSIKLNVSGGVPPLSYKWTGPNGFTAITKDILNVGPGSYAYTITQGDGAIYTSSLIDLSAQSNLAISNVNELSITPGGTQVSGANTCDGVAQVVFSGASGTVNILWSNGVTTATNSSLCGGAYGVTVTDAVGCSNNWSDALTVPAAISVTNTTVTPKCFGDKDGSARVKVSGGIEPYEVVWSNGQFDQVVFSNSFSQAVSLVGGVYTVTVTDKNFVSYTTTVTVPAAAPIEVTFTGIDPNSYNTCDGERIAFVTGAVDPVVYTWSGSYGHNGDAKRAEGLCAGEVLYFEITDANGCSTSVIDTVPYPPDGCFQVRPVLTPAEQDGNNDFTLITCIESAKSHTVEIYNRWGQLVFQTSNYNNNLGDPANTWTGYTRSGQSLPEGVYFYVLTFIDDENNQHQIKGPINLLK